MLRALSYIYSRRSEGNKSSATERARTMVAAKEATVVRMALAFARLDTAVEPSEAMAGKWKQGKL